MTSGRLFTGGNSIKTKLNGEIVDITKEIHMGKSYVSLGYLLEDKTMKLYINMGIERRYGKYKYRVLVDIMDRKVTIFKTLNNVYTGRLAIDNVDLSKLTINFFQVNKDGMFLTLNDKDYNLGNIEDIVWE